ncbi:MULTISPECIES: tRNA (adenine(22)-N(1))-methyltransferase [unclassified Sporolactobacillus]|uniref:tRNA (adenine(22)-N(1))-methyltransferase n=1 Tax=unclassified Sporolactobacillus TaxID=2628533 RepID=UPI002367F0C7|nr:class I SAM-dependent methyltransferase [Sporolactobacillus sp. CQH2019]MDD9147575.1 class I SAM-dependent methyltransferase [Sporolactobacillus sp. CQH2019]
MQTIHLSKRLQAVLAFIPQGAVLADIGADHAHLSCRAVQKGIAVQAIAGEVREGPFNQSLSNVLAMGMAASVSVRLGDGLDVIKRGEAGAIVIAGMGGELIADILERGRAKLAEGATLILQPNIREAVCRAWLASGGWTIIDEAIVEEPPHFYEIIKARRFSAGEIRLTDKELMMGPILLRNQTPVFRKKWSLRERKLRMIVQSLEQSEETEAVKLKRADCVRTLKMIGAVLKR